MLNMCLLSVIMLFCVLGIYFTVKEITSSLLKNRVHSRVYLEIHNCPDEAEHILRAAMSANPDSDIIISDRSGNDEIHEILEKLSNDNCRVKIQKGDVKKLQTAKR